MDLKKIAATLAIIAGLSIGGIELEQAVQLADIHAKNGVSLGMTTAMMSLSRAHGKAVRIALVEEFNKDGYVDYDNFSLHVQVMNDHFEKLKAEGEMPTWYFEPGAFTNEEKIKKIHDSLTVN